MSPFTVVPSSATLNLFSVAALSTYPNTPNYMAYINTLVFSSKIFVAINLKMKKYMSVFSSQSWIIEEVYCSFNWIETDRHANAALPILCRLSRSQICRFAVHPFEKCVLYRRTKAIAFLILHRSARLRPKYQISYPIVRVLCSSRRHKVHVEFISMVFEFLYYSWWRYIRKPYVRNSFLLSRGNQEQCTIFPETYQV